MSTLKSHINLLGYNIALLVTKFVGLPIIHNSVARRAFLFKLANIIVYVGMLSMLLTRMAEKHLCSNPRFVSKIYATSTTEDIVQYELLNRYIVLTGSFGI